MHTQLDEPSCDRLNDGGLVFRVLIDQALFDFIAVCSGEALAGGVRAWLTVPPLLNDKSPSWTSLVISVKEPFVINLNGNTSLSIDHATDPQHALRDGGELRRPLYLLGYAGARRLDLAQFSTGALQEHFNFRHGYFWRGRIAGCGWPITRASEAGSGRR